MTTLLYTMAGLERPNRGRVQLIGQDITNRPADAVSDLRLHGVGFVFQQADLVPELTLAQNVELPLELLGVGRRERVRDLLARLELTECAERRPNGVSGGQAQRAAIGRAVATRPRVVLADEPTGALDTENGQRALDLLLECARDVEALLVVVTHDPDIASRLDRRVHLRDGMIDGDTAHG